MQHISTTPFGRRPVTAGHLVHQKLAEAPAPADAPDKWMILKDLTTARAAFGVTDRDLGVLSALLSFHRSKALDDDGGTIVFPSNRALGERAFGMAESTLRRHIAALVAAGLILRHDSPNGKRYAARDDDGAVTRAFGFDLRPLLVRAAEIARTAREARAATDRLKRLREAVVLRLRDAAKLIAFGIEEGSPGDWEGLTARLTNCQKQLRRKPDAGALKALSAEADVLLSSVAACLDVVDTEESSANDIENERHIQYSNRNPYESESCKEQQDGGEGRPPSPPAVPALPLHLILKACPDLADYAPGRIRHWHELVAAARFVRPMLGISPDAWTQAERVMGPEIAAISVACILQKGPDIARPGGYLRALTTRAETNGFSPGPMVMALLRAETMAAV